MKECKSCKKVKDNSEYYKRLTSKDGMYSKCKSCMKSDAAVNYSENRDVRIAGMRKLYNKESSNGYVVYFIPEYNYVGVTNNLKRRVLNHKNNSKRYFEDYIIIDKFYSKREALDVEYQLHLQGFNGKHPNKK